jgi:hypothetical protein
MPIKLIDWRGDFPDQSNDPSMLSESYHWCVHIPRIHHALANPQAEVEFPAMPREDLDVLYFCAYWEPANYIMFFLLGWTQPGKGLLWWYKNNKETFGDARLQLLKTIWDYEGQLDLLAAWFWDEGKGPHSLEMLINLTARNVSSFKKVSPGKDWWEQFRRKYQNAETNPPNPLLTSGSNELHFGHCMGAAAYENHSNALFLKSSKTERKAVLLLEKARGWYGALAHHGKELPDIGDHSWYVDVIVKPIGWMGTFRRSRVTGLWFQGKHSVHMAGN